MSTQLQQRALYAAVLSLVGCNFQLVGGECLDGYALEDGRCLAVVEDGGAGGGIAAGGDTNVGGSDGGFGAEAGGGEAPAGGGPSAGAPQGGAGGGLSCDPLTACGGECVDIDSDPQNCGACGHACQTGLCGGGQCQGSSAGHVAAIGIDYQGVNAGSSAARLLGNAVFLHAHEPVRVALYTQNASNDVRDQVAALVGAEAAARGRSAMITNMLDASLLGESAQDLETDVVIVLPQPYAEPGEMVGVANTWALPLDDFTGAGGVLIVLAKGPGAEELLTASQWFGPLVLSAEPMQSLEISSWLDALSVGVLSPFALSHATTSLTPSAPLDAWTQIVVSTQVGAPVILHRVVAPGG